MIGLNRSILFNSVRRPKIQDLEIFVSGTVLIPFHDFTSFKIIFLPNLKDCTSSKLSQVPNCPKFKTVQDLKLSIFQYSDPGRRPLIQNWPGLKTVPIQ